MDKGFEIIQIHPFEDKRGCLRKVVMKSQCENGIEEVYLLYSSSGSVRGNHYHKKTLEYFVVVSGVAKIAVKDLNSGEYEELKISCDDNVVLKVPADVIHAFKNEEEQPLIILAVSSREYDKSDTDTYMSEILA